LGIGDWGLDPIPNPQSPIPNPQLDLLKYYYIIIYYLVQITFKINIIQKVLWMK